MKTNIKLLLASSGLAIAALGATPAFAAPGTAAGTDVLNTVTVNYNVGTVAQTAITASDTFKVDRKITVSVVENGTTTTSVSPNQTGQVTTFTVLNDSNATIDIGLTAAQIVGGTAAHGGTDTFNVNNMTMYVDNPVTGTVGSWDAGDAVVTYLDELTSGTSRTIFIVGDIPSTAVNGGIAGVTLTGVAQAGGTSGTQGANLTATAGANGATTIETVLLDAAGLTGDIANDGKSSDDDDYTVAAPLLSVYKTSRVVSDPVNGTTNPKAIPGAIVEYCLIVANATGGATASSVNLSDTLPTQVTYDTTNFVVKVGGTYTGTAPSGTCNADGTATAGAYSAGVVSGTLGSLTAGTTRTILFQAKIN
jgi:hypothetical protein